MIIRGWEGCINVLDEYFPHVTERVHVVDMLHMFSDAFFALSLQMEPEVLRPIVPRIVTTKDSRWPKSTTSKISLLRLIIFEVVCGVNLIKTIFPGTQQMDGSWKRLKKRRPMSMLQKKKNQSTSVPKKTHLGLQLDMGPQRSLVAICGFCVATRALAQRFGIERRQEEKTGRVNVALI